MDIESLRNRYISQLLNLYQSENQLVAVLPKLESEAISQRLKKTLHRYSREAKDQSIRIAKLVDHLGQNLPKEANATTSKLVEDAKQLLTASADPDTRDLDMLATAQLIGHYKMASYSTALAYAEQLGEATARKLLAKSLAEQKGMDQHLTELTKAYVSEGTNLKSGLTKKLAANSKKMLSWGIGAAAVSSLALGLFIASRRRSNGRQFRNKEEKWSKKINNFTSAIAQSVRRNGYLPTAKRTVRSLWELN